MAEARLFGRAGWPRERVGHLAAKNRVHVAVSTLRKLGLRDVLLSRDDGWLLDPHVALVRSDAPAGSDPREPG